MLEHSYDEDDEGENESGEYDWESYEEDEEDDENDESRLDAADTVLLPEGESALLDNFAEFTPGNSRVFVDDDGDDASFSNTMGDSEFRNTVYTEDEEGGFLDPGFWDDGANNNSEDDDIVLNVFGKFYDNQRDRKIH